MLADHITSIIRALKKNARVQYIGPDIEISTKYGKKKLISGTYGYKIRDGRHKTEHHDKMVIQICIEMRPIRCRIPYYRLTNDTIKAIDKLNGE